MSEQPTKFCKDCANFKSPDLCHVGDGVNYINGATFPQYMSCGWVRSNAAYDTNDHCGPEARRFVPIDPAKAPAHRSSLGFILRHVWKRDSE